MNYLFTIYTSISQYREYFARICIHVWLEILAWPGLERSLMAQFVFRQPFSHMAGCKSNITGLGYKHKNLSLVKWPPVKLDSNVTYFVDRGTTISASVSYVFCQSVYPVLPRRYTQNETELRFKSRLD